MARIVAGEVLDLTESDSSESDWQGDFYRPSHLFFSMQPPEGRLATTQRSTHEKGGKYFRVRGPGERDQTRDRKQLQLRRVTEGTWSKDGKTLLHPGMKIKKMHEIFKAADPPEASTGVNRPRATSVPCTPLTVDSLEDAKKYEKRCKAFFDKETTPSQAKLILSQLQRVQAIVRYIDKYLQLKAKGEHADKTEIQLRTHAAKESGTQTYRVKGDKGVQ